MNILLCGDDNRVEQIATVIASVVGNCATPEKLRFHVLADMTADNKQRLVYWCAGIDVSLPQVDLDALSDLPKSTFAVPHVTQAAWLRVFAAEALPAVQRVIYLDADVLAFADVAELWDIDLGESGLGAAPSLLGSCLEAGVPPQLISEDRPYFNSGVLLCDLDYWRAHAVSKSIAVLVAENGSDFNYPDQDALNIVFPEWVDIGREWNNTQVSRLSRAGAPAEEVAEELKSTKIAHFTSGQKPWQADYPNGPGKTAWASFAPKKRT